MKVYNEFFAQSQSDRYVVRLTSVLALLAGDIRGSDTLLEGELGVVFNC